MVGSEGGRHLRDDDGRRRAAGRALAPARAAAEPRDPAHWYNLGATLYRSGADGKATAAWTLAARLAPPAGALHVGDLDGVATSVNRSWTASVTALALDDAGAAFAGAVVSGAWSTGATSSCTTGAGGTCAVGLGGIKGRTASVTFTVTSLTAPGRAYDPGANIDPDGDSTGTSIVIAAP